MWCLPWKTKFLSVFTFLRCSVLPRLCSPPLFKTKEAILQPYFDQDPLPFLEGVEVTQPVGLSILFAHTLIGTHIASVNVLLHSLKKTLLKGRRILGCRGIHDKGQKSVWTFLGKQILDNCSASLSVSLSWFSPAISSEPNLTDIQSCIFPSGEMSAFKHQLW